MTHAGNRDLPGGGTAARTATPPSPATWDSALSSEDFAAIGGVGFQPVGQVLGTAVFNVGYTGLWGCPGNWSVTDDNTPAPTARWAPSHSQLVRTMYAARRTALARAVAECGALGGDGIVGVELHIGEFPAGGLEFTARGTAVRARSRIRPRTPFTSHLSGQDFANLLHAGWVPVALAFGIAFAIRHDDWRTSLRIPRTTRNQEVDCYTQLIGHARREARRQLVLDTGRHGGDGVVVDHVGIRVEESECPSYGSSRDLTAEAVLVGTTIARFGRPERSAGTRPPLTIMRLERER
ncbi:heavy metal-binding domain-containing protein [Streptomyces virginiae]|uniref:heavy metal-binding domain-containing protein n=1 Tax=Streptomyces virginiae TaxID=1961 RepID=UPI0038031A4B